MTSGDISPFLQRVEHERGRTIPRVTVDFDRLGWLARAVDHEAVLNRHQMRTITNLAVREITLP